MAKMKTCKIPSIDKDMEQLEFSNTDGDVQKGTTLRKFICW